METQDQVIFISVYFILKMMVAHQIVRLNLIISVKVNLVFVVAKMVLKRNLQVNVSQYSNVNMVIERYRESALQKWCVEMVLYTNIKNVMMAIIIQVIHPSIKFYYFIDDGCSGDC